MKKDLENDTGKEATCICELDTLVEEQKSGPRRISIGIEVNPVTKWV